MMVKGIDAIALSSTPIVLLQDQTPVSLGTGFFFAHPIAEGQFVISLVTNYHVVTGSAPRRRQPPKGNAIQFEIRRADVDVVKVTRVRFPLLTSDGKKTWLSCPTFPEADVAVVPLPLNQGMFETAPYCLDQATMDFDLTPFPGQSVSIVGYPWGLSDRVNKLPLWKTGHIASEPELDFDGDPKFLVDVTGRKGMSGAPVFAGHMHPYLTRSGQLRYKSSGKLLGVYSSSVIRQESADASPEELSIEEASEGLESEGSLRAELGIAWKSRLISETLSSLDLPSYRKEVWSRLGP